MPPQSEAPVLEPAQAAALALLVDLEARWENLRKHSPPPPDVGESLKDLSAKQKAYDAFRARLVAYNKRYRPAHVPELLLNTPLRLGAWCRAMRDLYLQVGHDGQVPCPVDLLDKAYRWADQIGVRMDKSPVIRTTPPAAIGDAVRDLEALERWCKRLTGAAQAGPLPKLPTLPDS
jgi:hypothetical protein